MQIPEIIPAILSDNMEDYVKFSNQYSKFTKRIHIDVMDGNFVLAKSPNVFDILDSIKDVEIEKSIHLMIKNPVNTVSILGETGSNVFLVYVHVETISEEIYAQLLSLDFPFKIGFVFDPRTDFDKYAHLLTKTHIIQIMTVDPGTQGADFIPETLDKITVLRNKYNYKGEIHIDGHINAITLPTVMQFQPDVLNIGSAIQRSEDPENSFKNLSGLCRQY